MNTAITLFYNGKPHCVSQLLFYCQVYTRKTICLFVFVSVSKQRTKSCHGWYLAHVTPVILRHLVDMWFIHRGRNKSHFPSLPQNNPYIITWSLHVQEMFITEKIGFEGFFKGKSPWIEITRRCGSFSVTQFLYGLFCEDYATNDLIVLWTVRSGSDAIRTALFTLKVKLIFRGKHRRLWPLKYSKSDINLLCMSLLAWQAVKLKHRLL